MPNNIDPTRLAAIFKALSSTESLQTNRQNNDKKARETLDSPAIKVKKPKKRDRDELKRRLKAKLTALKNESSDFDEAAPGVAIKEILFWEFGDELINHPDFNLLSNKIVEQIKTSKELMSAFKGLTDQLL